MLLPPAFGDTLQSEGAMVISRLKNALRIQSPADAAEADSAYQEFRRFLELLEELKAAPDPVSLLHHHKDNIDKTSDYYLAYGRWRGLFVVDWSRCQCMGIRVRQENNP